MVKDGTLNTLAIIGYAFACIFTVMAVVIGIYWGATGFKIKEKEIDVLVFVAPENTDEEVVTQNNTMNISTAEIQKIIEFSVAGTEKSSEEAEKTDNGGISKKIILTINNEYKNFKEAETDKTSIWFVEKDEKGNPKQVVDDETGESHYVKKETNRLVARVDEKIYIMLATTTYDDTTLYDFFGEDADIEDYQKDYIKGGLSYIHAKSEDGLFSAKDLEVKVDIPVEAAKIVVEGYNYNGVKADLTDRIEKTQKIEYRNLITTPESLVNFVTFFNFDASSLGTTIYYETTEENSDVYDGSITYKSGNFYTVRETNGTISFVENTDLTFSDLQYFLQGTDLELNIKTFPENAISPLSKTSKSFVFDLHGVSNDTATLKEENDKNILKIDKQVGGTFTPGAITIQASVQGLLKDETKSVTTTLVVQAARAEAESVEKKSAINSIVVLVNNTSQNNINTEIHACGNAEGGSNYLDIEVIPKFYNQHNNPFKGDYSSLKYCVASNHGTEEGQVNVTSLANSFQNVITCTPDSQDNTDKIYRFTASRFLFGDEEINFQLSVNDEFDEQKTITIPIIPTIINPTSNDEVSYTRSHDIPITKYDKEFLSEVIGATVENDSVSDQQEVVVNVANTSGKAFTYAKWVYFLSTAKAKNENDAPAQTMDVEEDPEETELPAVKATKEGQLVSKNGEHFGNQIYAQNTGSVAICPKLVLCDKDGNPLNYKYVPLTVDDNTGYVLFNFDSTNGKEITTFASLSVNEDPYDNCYVVLYDTKTTINVNVTGRLEFAFFYDYNDGKYSNLFKAEINNETFSETIEVPADSTTRYVYARASSSEKLDEIYADGDKNLQFTISGLNSDPIEILKNAEYLSKDGVYTGIRIPISISSEVDPFTAQVKLEDSDAIFGNFIGKSIDINVAKNSGIFEEVTSLISPDCLTASDVGKIVRYSGTSFVTSKSFIYDSKFAIGDKIYVIVNEQDVSENNVVNIYEGEEKGEAEPVATLDINSCFTLTGDDPSISYHINGYVVETYKTLAAGYYIVQEKSGEAGVYEWAPYKNGVGHEVDIWWNYDHNNINPKEIKMKYGRDSDDQIPFVRYYSLTNPVDCMNYESCNIDGYICPFYIPRTIYKTLNITRTKWNMGAVLTKTTSDEFEIVNYNGTGALALNTYNAVNILNPEHIKLREQTVDGKRYLAIDLYEDWQTEISNLYLVYKTSVNGTLKAIDVYKLTFEDTNYILTEQTFNSQNNLIFENSSNPNELQLKLDSNNIKISDLVKLIDNNTPTYYELDPEYITAKLFRETTINNTVELEDLSDYIQLTINASGEIICSCQSGYEFSTNSSNPKISTADTLKLVLYMFGDNSTVFFVIEINKTCNLSLNVIQQAS